MNPQQFLKAITREITQIAMGKENDSQSLREGEKDTGKTKCGWNHRPHSAGTHSTWLILNTITVELAHAEEWEKEQITTLYRKEKMLPIKISKKIIASNQQWKGKRFSVCAWGGKRHSQNEMWMKPPTTQRRESQHLADPQYNRCRTCTGRGVVERIYYHSI